ncbi:MAG: glycosyltransferase family 4 protein [Candidatus Nealsonbacteria bacterium]
MKLIYIANARIPTEKAHGIQIMKMCEAFTERTDELELLVPNRMNWIKQDPFTYYEVKRSFKIKKFFCLDLIPFDRYLGHLALWIESITFFISILFYVLFKKAGIIYTRNKFLLISALFKKNFVFEAHAIFQNYFLYSLFLKRTKRIIVTSQKIKEFFIENGVPSGKILVAPNGVDMEQFDIKETQEECRRKLSLSLNKKIVLYTGHLYSWKGVDTLARASRYLPEEVMLYFVGGAEKDIKNFKLQTSNLKLNIVGHRPHSEIPLWLRAADILILPDLAVKDILKYGASPMKMFEYMASKRPIIASNLPSIREILNKNNSLLVKPNDPERLVRDIKKVLEDPNFSDKISNQAFQDVQNYTWQKRAGKILKFIKQ